MSELTDKVALINFNPDDKHQHLAIIKQADCVKCKPKPCLTVCPTGVFAWDNCEQSPVLVFYKQCVECGACRISCPCDNIAFSFPNDNHGVAYGQG